MSNAGLIKIESRTPIGKLSIKKIAKLKLLQAVDLEDRESKNYKNYCSDSGAQDTLFPLMPMESVEKPIFNHFPCLLQPDGSPWALGNLYLLDLVATGATASQATVEKHALALQDFFGIMLDLGLNFLNFSLRKARRPTYAYSYHYRDVIKEFPRKGQRANAMIRKIVAFYRWLLQRGFVPEQAMWKESTGYIRLKNKAGMSYDKKITRTDLTLKVIKNLGAKALRAYDEAEQKALVETLLQIDNTEMTLGFLLAIVTGARLQTVFTLQANALDGYDGRDYHPVVVGEGGFADSKFQKRFPILIPGWLVLALKTYLASKRYAARKDKSFYSNTESTYIFLAKTGAPYYAKGDDTFASDYRSQRIGKSVQAFIFQQLNPALAQSGYAFKARFHNLRASFSENVVVDNLDRLNAGIITWIELLNIVSERLAHSSIEETENYINSVRKKQIKALAQRKFESYLEAKLRTTWEAN
ncbi:integrase [Pseudomonas viridiflava]|uniref:integrase n=1 Tax=Pseudomonas viridiflava TaxID=33069 RepID=UPI002EA104F5|nr:integrase [Pseudomonas viridiflava]